MVSRAAYSCHKSMLLYEVVTYEYNYMLTSLNILWLINNYLRLSLQIRNLWDMVINTCRLCIVSVQ